jgi:hypothetical protein
MSENTRRPYTVSSPDEAVEVLRARFQQDGYLFMKRAVSADICQALLGEILEQLHPHIAVEQHSGLPLLAGDPFFETDAVWDEVYPRIQRLESFHRFFHRPELGRLMSLVAGDDHFVYPMKMARIATPRKIGFETPPHQDAHSHHAGPTMAGIWVALHDVDDTMGRVTVLPRSHLLGVRPVFEAAGVGGVQCEIYEDETEWHVSDYERGDVLIFHSATVHKAEPNTAEQRVRISVDTRFCDYGAPVFSTNLEPHHGWRIAGLDWDSIYSGWQHPREQYYWRSYPNLF